MHIELLRGTDTRIHLIDCTIEEGNLTVGAAYLPPWLKPTQTLTDGEITYTVKFPDSLTNQYAPASCVDLKLELG